MKFYHFQNEQKLDSILVAKKHIFAFDSLEHLVDQCITTRTSVPILSFGNNGNIDISLDHRYILNDYDHTDTTLLARISLKPKQAGTEFDPANSLRVETVDSFPSQNKIKIYLPEIEAIINADNEALNNVKTDRTKYITSISYLSLAREEKARFETIKLSLPLKTSLRKKKSSMQDSVKMYGNASVNQINEVVTESTFSIAQIYKDFSQSLLKSDRPEKLTDEQLDQYEILLEDQAFPFEDKAIEFFEINLSRVSEGLYDDWIDKSFVELINLYPARYNRKPKQDGYVAEMQ